MTNKVQKENTPPVTEESPEMQAALHEMFMALCNFQTGSATVLRILEIKTRQILSFKDHPSLPAVFDSTVNTINHKDKEMALRLVTNLLADFSRTIPNLSGRWSAMFDAYAAEDLAEAEDFLEPVKYSINSDRSSAVGFKFIDMADTEIDRGELGSAAEKLFDAHDVFTQNGLTSHTGLYTAIACRYEHFRSLAEQDEDWPLAAAILGQTLMDTRFLPATGITEQAVNLAFLCAEEDSKQSLSLLDILLEYGLADREVMLKLSKEQIALGNTNGPIIALNALLSDDDDSFESVMKEAVQMALPLYATPQMESHAVDLLKSILTCLDEDWFPKEKLPEIEQIVQIHRIALQVAGNDDSGLKFPEKPAPSPPPPRMSVADFLGYTRAWNPLAPKNP